MSRALRVLFAGTPDVALPSLDLLHSDPRIDVVAVLTNPDRAKGRSGTPSPSPVAERAIELGLPLLRPERPADAEDAMRASGAELGAVVAYGAILPASVLLALPHGFVNLHFSLLPRWRGAAPVQHAIRAGDEVTGVTAFRLDEGMDTGPILRRLEVRPREDVDAGTLLDELASRGAPVLLEALLAVASGEQGVDQPSDGATRAPRIRPEDAEVDWSSSAEVVSRTIRSVTPRPGAFTALDGERIKLAGVVPSAPDGAEDRAAAPPTPPAPPVPGAIVAADDAGIVVACGSGSVRIARVQLAGRPWASAADQVRGRRLAVGMVLGAEVERT
jgi:methionyl-tRNA formyltransferase